MAEINIGSLQDWVLLGQNVTIPVAGPTDGALSAEVRIDWIVPGNMMVLFQPEQVSGQPVPQKQLVALCKGGSLETVVFTVSGPGSVSAYFPAPNGSIWPCYRRQVHTQDLPESTDVSFTEIEPAASSPDADVQRMLMMAQLNAARREQALMEHIEEQESRLAAIEARDAVLEPEPVVPPAPPVSEEI